MKIVVLGQFNAGKSSLVRAICGEGSSVSIDKYGTTISLDHGLAIKYNIKLSIFGTPGLERFEILRKILSEGADGVIFLIDSINSMNSGSETKQLYLKLMEQLPNTPVIIGSNKQDLKEALSPSTVIANLDLPENDALITFLPLSAKTGNGVNKILSLLVFSVLSRYKGILTAVRIGGKQGLKGIRKALKKPPKDNKNLHDLIQWLSWRGLVTVEDQKYKVPEHVKEIIDIFEYTQDYGLMKEMDLS